MKFFCFPILLLLSLPVFAQYNIEDFSTRLLRVIKAEGEFRKFSPEEAMVAFRQSNERISASYRYGADEVTPEGKWTTLAALRKACKSGCAINLIGESATYNSDLSMHSYERLYHMIQDTITVNIFVKAFKYRMHEVRLYDIISDTLSYESTAGSLARKYDGVEDGLALLYYQHELKYTFDNKCKRKLLFAIADIHKRSDRCDQAIPAWQSVIALDNDTLADAARASYNISVCYRFTGDTVDLDYSTQMRSMAFVLADNSLKKYPTNASAYKIKLRLLQDQGEEMKTEAFIRQVDNLFPASAEMQLLIAHYYRLNYSLLPVKAKEHRITETYLKKVLQLDPVNNMALGDLVLFYEAQGKTSKQITYLKKLKSLYPGQFRRLDQTQSPAGHWEFSYFSEDMRYSLVLKPSVCRRLKLL